MSDLTQTPEAPQKEPQQPTKKQLLIAELNTVLQKYQCQLTPYIHYSRDGMIPMLEITDAIPASKPPAPTDEERAQS